MKISNASRPIINKVWVGSIVRTDPAQALRERVKRYAHAPIKNVLSTFVAVVVFALEASAFAQTPPAKFVTQIIEPTGGKIPRPKAWFYAERHHGPVYDWMITREDTHGGTGPYTTGVRIQMFSRVKDGTGKSAQQFILDFIAAKKKEAAKVIKTCEPKEQDLFTRICLETEEGPHHILYSLFWGRNDFDYAVVVIAGTTRELWGTYAPVFDQMSFELIDLKRFEK